MKDHILTETIAKANGILEHCMYCHTEFGHDGWQVHNKGFSNYITIQCDCCKRTHRFEDKNIHTIEDLLEKINLQE